MYPADALTKDLERNRRVVHAQCEGLSNADSLRQPPFRANCLNWVVGHVVCHRDKMLTDLDASRVLPTEVFDRYDNSSDPIGGAEPGVATLGELLGWLDESQEALAGALAATDMSEEIEIGDRVVPRWKRLHFLYFHETYHVGQTELLRQLAGVDDAVI